MALTRKWILLVSAAICLFACTIKYGQAHNDDHLGGAEVVADEFVPEARHEEDEGEVPEARHEEDEGEVPEARHEEDEGEDQDPDFIHALECFNDRNIYSMCDEEYRLSEKGELKVPHEYADQYCEGPCREETNLVLECIHQIFQHFRFHNKATLNDVKETINAACSYGPKRGDFDVAEHVRVDEDISSKLMSSYIVIYAALLMILGWRVLF